MVKIPRRDDGQIVAHFLPHFGARPLDEITKSDMVRYLNFRRTQMTGNPGHKNHRLVSESSEGGDQAAQQYVVSDSEPTIEELFEDGRAIDEALKEAARDARRFHKAMGNPMATWVDGHVVLVQPDDIVVDDEPASRAKPGD